MIKISSISVSLLLSSVTAIASAASILPDATGFGALPGATFGSPTSSIPNNAVAQESNSANTVTLGLSATQRFSNPALTNDGAGTFFAQPGTDTNPPSPGNPYALWNFNYAILGSAANLANYNYRLYYDFSPTFGNDISTHGYFTLIGATLNTSPFTPGQNSLNLGMDFLAPFNALANPTGNPFAPPGSSLTTFNPNAVGEYTFKLAAFNTSDVTFSSSAFETSMLVSAVPEPGEWAMMLAGLGVVGAIARRRRNK